MICQVLLVPLFTLVGTLTRPLSAQDVQQTLQYVIIPEGGSVDITCSTSEALRGIYLVQSWPQNSDVIYYEDGRTPTVDNRFSGRINFSGSQENLTITIRLLQLTDSGAYTCRPSMERALWGSTTMVVVTEELFQGAYRCQEPPLASVTLPAALAVGFFLVGLGLGVLCMLRKTQIKKLCASREKNLPCVVYEDMSCSHLNASSVPNQYQ